MRLIYRFFKGFFEDDCYTKASALAFYTLLSIVPFLAVLFGVAKGFGLDQALQIDLQDYFHGQEEILKKLIEFAHSWLHTVKGGWITGIGMFFLLWTVLGLLSAIESSLDAIWKVPVPRSFTRRMTNYLAILFVSPPLLVASSSLTLSLATQLTENTQDNALLEHALPFLSRLPLIFPYLLTGFLFTFLYWIVPNTQVSGRSALLAGVLSGIVFQLWQWLYIYFQIGVSSYGAIYGSFAAFPLFLIWLQISWLIFLAGAELAYSFEKTSSRV